MYITILLLPLLGASISGFFGRKIGITGSHLITTLFLFITSLLSTVAFYEIGISSSPVTIHLSQWIDSEFLSISWEFLFDSLTVSMLIPVLYVSTLVHIYSISYMSEDPHNQRFFSYLSLFTFFMVVLVTGANYLIMFIGWEGIGVSSYLLINFWYTRIQANKAAILAFTMNRVGDMSLSIAFFSLFWVFGNLDYASIFTLSPYINENLISIIGLLLLLAAMGKSAQIGLHGWLPGSMEGPTPVSALIHAATLVTAGVYLLMRSSPLIEYGSTALIVIMWVGSITAFFAASSGLLQNDLKRIIAFSTISQMGYLFMAVGLSQYNVALFHLVNHAFFKALLFLAAGSVIHAMHDQQDIRRLGGLISFLPFTYTSILIGSLSLMALPWLTGFYSKDLIIELAYAKYQFSGMACYYLGTLTAIFTAFYSFRLISLVFLTYPNAPKNDYLNSHEASLSVVIPLSLLSLASIFFGFIFSDLFVGMGTDFFGNSLFIHPNHISLIEAEFSLPLIYKLLPTIGSVLAALLALYLYHSKSLSLKNSPLFGGQALIELTDYSIGRKIYTFFNGKYLLDIIYNKYIIGKGLSIGYTIAKILDRGIYETVGPLGLSNHLMNTGKNISKLDNGKITDYATYMAIAAITIPVGILMNINNFNRIFIFLLGSLILFNLIPNIFGSNYLKNKNNILTKSILPLPLINTFDYSDLYNNSNLEGNFSLINISWRLEDIEEIFNNSIQGILNLYPDHIYISMILFWIVVKFMYFFIHRKLYQLKLFNTINNLTYKLLNFIVLYIILRLSLWLFIYPMLYSLLNTFNEYNSLTNTMYSIIESEGWKIWIKTILDITTGLTLFNVMNLYMYSEGGSIMDIGDENSVLSPFPSANEGLREEPTLYHPSVSSPSEEGKAGEITRVDTNTFNISKDASQTSTASGLGLMNEGTIAKNENISLNNIQPSVPKENSTPTIINFSSLLTETRLPTVQEATAILNYFLADVPSSSSSSAPDPNSRWIAVSFDPNENKDVASIHILHGKDRKLALKALTVAEAEDCSMKIPSLEHYGALFEPRLITTTDGKHSYQLWTTEFTHSKQLDAHYILDVVKFSQKVKNQVGLINGIIARENVTPDEIKQALKKFMTVTPESDLFEERFRDKYYQPKVKYFYDKRLTSSWNMVPKFVPGLGDTKVLDIQTIETPENAVNNTISKRIRRKPGAH